MMDCSNLDDEKLGEMVSVIRKKKVKCLIGYSAALGEISRYIDRHQIDTTDFCVRLFFLSPRVCHRKCAGIWNASLTVRSAPGIPMRKTGSWGCSGRG